MGNGLFISVDEFKKLPQKQQLICLYENQVKTFHEVTGYKFFQKISATIGSFLLAGMGILFKMFFSLKLQMGGI